MLDTNINIRGNKKRLRVAVVGCGHLGGFHAEKYSTLANLELVAVCDIISERADKLASRFSDITNCVALADYKDLIKLNIDCVSVATDTQAHYEVANFLLEHGIDVLLEKPMTHDLTSAHKLVDRAKNTDCIFQVGHIERFNPAIRKLKEYIVNPWFFEVKRIAPFKPRGVDVDVVLDLMIHDIDLLLYLINKPVIRIDAMGIPVLTSSVDIANARIEFAGGEVANVSSSRVASHSERTIRIFQPSSYIALDLEAKTIKRLKKDTTGDSGLDSISRMQEEILSGDALKDEIESFVQSVITRTKPRVTGEDGLRVMELIEEIKKQMKISAGKFAQVPEELTKALRTVTL